jgi:hypothetical protein
VYQNHQSALGFRVARFGDHVGRLIPEQGLPDMAFAVK